MKSRITARSSLVIGALAISTVLAADCRAQVAYGVYGYNRPYYGGSYSSGYPAYGYRGYGYGGFGYRGFNYGGTTAAGSYTQGLASLVQAQGQRNLANSQAAQNYSEAQSQYIQNRSQALEAYYDRKQKYDEYQEQQRYEDAERREERLSKVRLQPLDEQEFNEATGDITWPAVAAMQQFGQYRESLDQLFQDRAKYGALQSSGYLAAKQSLKQFREAMLAIRGSVPEESLSESLRFLLKLDRKLEGGVG